MGDSQSSDAIHSNRRLSLHLSALTEEEYAYYKRALDDLQETDELDRTPPGRLRERGADADYSMDEQRLGIREVRAWMKGRFCDLRANDIDRILDSFQNVWSAATSELSCGQFFAALRLALHALNGKGITKSNAFIQAYPTLPCKRTIQEGLIPGNPRRLDRDVIDLSEPTPPDRDVIDLSESTPPRSRISLPDENIEIVPLATPPHTPKKRRVTEVRNEKATNAPEMRGDKQRNIARYDTSEHAGAGAKAPESKEIVAKPRTCSTCVRRKIEKCVGRPGYSCEACRIIRKACEYSYKRTARPHSVKSKPMRRKKVQSLNGDSPEIPSWFERKALGLLTPTPEYRKDLFEVEALEHFYCAVENYHNTKGNLMMQNEKRIALRLMTMHAKEVIGFRLERKRREGEREDEREDE